MLPMGNIFFPLIVAHLRRGFFYVEIYSTLQKLIFEGTDSNILRICVNLLLIA